MHSHAEGARPATTSAGGKQANRGSGGAFFAGGILIALVIFGYYETTWGSFGGFLSAIDVWYEPFADFQRYYCPMGQAVLSGAGPVEGFVYSPAVALIMAPFAMLGCDLAVIVWGILLVAGIIAYIWLFRQLVPAGLPLQWLFVADLLLSFPLLHTFKFGQVTLFSMIAILSTLLLAERGHTRAAAASLGLAACFKWHPALFLAPFWARRDFRFLLWTAIAGVSLLLLAPVVLMGLTRTGEFYRTLWMSYTQFDWVLTSYNTQYFPNVVQRLAAALDPGADRLATTLWLNILRGFTWCVVLANLGLVYLIQRARLGRADLWSFQVLFLNVPFLLGTSWPVDLVSLPFAQTVLCWALLDANGIPSGEGVVRARKPQGLGWRMVGLKRAVPVGLLVMLSVAFSSVVLFNLIGDRLVYGSLGFVFWADALSLIATYMVLIPAVWPRRDRGKKRPRTPNIQTNEKGEASASPPRTAVPGARPRASGRAPGSANFKRGC